MRTSKGARIKVRKILLTSASLLLLSGGVALAGENF